MIDKNQAIIDFLLQCPQIAESPLYFNFVNAKADNKEIITQGNERTLHRPYIDGSVLKRYTFTVIDFKAMTDMAIPRVDGYINENVDELWDTQGIIDWVDEQAENKSFPDFGEDCIIDRMTVLTDSPNLNGVDTRLTPALAKYSISIQIEYLDISKAIK